MSSCELKTLKFSLVLHIRENFDVFKTLNEIYYSRSMRFPTMWYVRPAKAQTSLRIGTD